MKDASKHNADKRSDKKTLSIVHLLHPFVKQRIKVGENLGVFPKNMYRPNEIIDEVVLEIYENGIHEEMDIDQLRLMMFDLSNNKLMSLFENEKWHKKSISTKHILDEELSQLEEKYTMDADNDLIMNEDLDDISYHQDDHIQLLPYEDAQDNVFSFLDVKDVSQFKDLKYDSGLFKTYYTLPVQTSNVVDLYILGKLNMQEIASILHLEVVEVKRIIDYAKEKFKKHLD
ncbi:MAG: hypothetical protein OEM04_08875 [Flavobacteriaceae bacterium]|nr:hypothetical protein [Flavobacteriaceae bacterium]